MVSVLLVLDELFLPKMLVVVKATFYGVGISRCHWFWFIFLFQFGAKVKFSNNICGRRTFGTSKNSLSTKEVVC